MSACLATIGLGQIEDSQLDQIADFGIRGLSIVPDNITWDESPAHWIQSIRKFQTAVTKRGMKIGSIQGVFFDCDVREPLKVKERTRVILAMARETGASSIVVGAPASRKYGDDFVRATHSLENELSGLSEVLMENICPNPGACLSDSADWVFPSDQFNRVWDYANWMTCQNNARQVLPRDLGSLAMLHLSGKNHGLPSDDDLSEIRLFRNHFENLIERPLQIVVELPSEPLERRLSAFRSLGLLAQ